MTVMIIVIVIATSHFALFIVERAKPLLNMILIHYIMNSNAADEGIV